MYNQGWPGHSQPEIAEIFRELTDHVPQIPVGKIVKGVKALIASPTQHQDEHCSEAMPSTALVPES